MVCLAQNGMLGLDQLRWLATGWMGGAFCVASYVHGHQSMWVTDACMQSAAGYLPGRN